MWTAPTRTAPMPDPVMPDDSVAHGSDLVPQPVDDHTPPVATTAGESTIDVMAANMRANLDSGTAGVAAAEGLGGVGGLAAGAVVGSLAGPVGTLIGAIAGAVGGWWAGREVAVSVEELAVRDADTDFRRHFDAESAKSDSLGVSYDQSRPLYQLGHLAARNPHYMGKPFQEVEPELARGWTDDLEREYGPWSSVRARIATGYTTPDSTASGTASSTTGSPTTGERDLAIARQKVRDDEAALSSERAT